MACGLEREKEGGEGEAEGGEKKLSDSKCRWKFSVRVAEVIVPMESVTISMSEDPAPYMYCFLRYRFFDSGKLPITNIIMYLLIVNSLGQICFAHVVCAQMWHVHMCLSK